MVKHKRINYKRIVQSIAMSKMPNQSGIFISESGNKTIKFEAINPKMNDVTSWLSLEIPIENIDDVIGALTELKKEINVNS